LTGPIAEDQNILADVVGKYLQAGTMVVVLGGGHEASFGHFLGYVNAGVSPAIVNVDAHLDVRPLVNSSGHSGSAFRQALQSEPHAAVSYSVFGLAPHSTSRSHLDFVAGRPGDRVWNYEATFERFNDLLADQPADVMLSIDLDAFLDADAPGVSAPNPEGLDRALGYQLAYAAGRSSSVRSIDICEMNPEFDVDNRTARLAAMLVWHFVEGLTTRKGMLDDSGAAT
jgi:formiminoglutamase